MKSNKLFILLVLAITIQACGGSSSQQSSTPVSSGSPQPNNPPTQPVSDSQIIKTGANRTTLELLTAAENLVNNKYQGPNQKGILNFATSSFLLSTLLENKQLIAAESAIIYSLDRELNNDALQTINCALGGDVKIENALNNMGVGNIVFDYQNCKVGSIFTLDGVIGITIVEPSQNMRKISAYYSDLSVAQSDIRINLNGYMDAELPVGTLYDTYKYQDMYLLIQDQQSDTSFKLDGELLATYERSNRPIYNMQGQLTLSDFGVINFDLDNFFYDADIDPELATFVDSKVSLSSHNNAEFDFLVLEDFSTILVLYQEDSNGDGEFDHGVYYRNQYELIVERVLRELFPVEVLSMPPLAPVPNIAFGLEANRLEIYTTTDIEITSDPSTYRDPDTPFNELDISYRWYLNGELLEGYTSDSLPANIAVYGDIVTVQRIVKDASNTIESKLSRVAIADSLPVLTLQNAPNTALPNQIVSFRAMLSDPDIPSSEIEPLFFDGPKGAKFESGIINWTVPSSQLFPSQHYQFSFYMNESNVNNVATMHSIKVDNTQNNTQVISNFDYEIDKDLVISGDFNGDGQNELALATSQGRIHILTPTDGEFVFDWTNAFSLQITSQIQQIISGNFDEDTQDEILILSRDGVFLLQPYREGVTQLYSPHGRAITTSKIILIDDTPHLFLTIQTADSLNYELKSINLNNAIEQTLIENVDIIPSFYALGNTDLDNNLELVLDTGLVIDLSTLEIEWDVGSLFGIKTLNTVDVNQDGIDEIISVTDESGITIYDAQNKEQRNIDLGFSVCDSLLANVVGDNKSELLIQPCFSTSFSAFELISGELNQAWEYAPDRENVFGMAFLEVAPFDQNAANTLVYFGGNTDNQLYGLSSLSLASTGSRSVESNFLKYSEIQTLGWHPLNGVTDTAAFFVDLYQQASAWYFLSVDANTNQTFSDRFSQLSSTEPQKMLFDMNLDGVFEVPVPLYSSESSISLLNVADASETFMFDYPEYISGSSTTQIGDINEDEQMDLIISHQEGFLVIDYETNQVIAERSYSDRVTAVLVDDSGSQTYIYTLGINSLYVSSFIEGDLVDYEPVAQSCYSIFLINYDEDIQQEVACYVRQNNSRDDIHIFDISNGQILLKQSVSTNLDIIDIVPDPTEDSQQGFLVVTRFNLDVNENLVYPVLAKLDRNGALIYRSPVLFDTNSLKSLKARRNVEGKTEMLYSTDNIGYWFRE